MVAPTEPARVEPEELLQVEVAEVVEVPAGAGVAGDALLPPGVVNERIVRRLGDEGREEILVRHVGEGEALAGEAEAARPGVGQLVAVAADAVVVRDAAVRPDRQRAAGRGADGTYRASRPASRAIAGAISS